jgi:hypothetical protein
VKIVDCSRQTISLLNPDSKISISLTLNSSTSYSVNLSERFSATESSSCPITSYIISKVELESSSLINTDYVNWIGIGNNTTLSTADDYYTNFVLKDLTKSRDKI